MDINRKIAIKVLTKKPMECIKNKYALCTIEKAGNNLQFDVNLYDVISINVSYEVVKTLIGSYFTYVVMQGNELTSIRHNSEFIKLILI